MINVRPANAEDFDFVRQDRYTSAAAEERIRRKLSAGEILVAEEGGMGRVDQSGASGTTRCGYLHLDYFWSKVPFIAMIYVLPEFQRQGAGMAMLNYLETQLRMEGHVWLYSSSEVDHPAPQAWHRHVGFVECGIINGINGGEIGEIFFRKRL